jgi:Protein of unknown function (DUF1566)
LEHGDWTKASITSIFMIKVKLFFVFLLTCMSASYAAPVFVVSHDASEVSDSKTGLIWRRCAEGMLPVAGTPSSCTGTATPFTHQAALARAVSQATGTALAWRLPTSDELLSIVDHESTSPAIDTVAFPSTPESWFWSSSSYLFYSRYAGGVSFANGFTEGLNRFDAYYVRLVRSKSSN